jgi:hypothetical protein
VGNCAISAAAFELLFALCAFTNEARIQVRGHFLMINYRYIWVLQWYDRIGIISR